ncbi:hypothetical protein Agabi119p4_6832 [Agaricus bisporus var. burnettii]|uniref:Uncharacterized protein n=1 Tax=Agaricus bisporus var. burnettii TaxID=192524 RepID=A0A8H7F0A8_AGABI|nr:hypothetical protein Agabi119p4_6832 [Agaricus bisporus var. burnettii]
MRLDTNPSFLSFIRPGVQQLESASWQSLASFSRRAAILERLPHNLHVTRTNAPPSLMQKSVSMTDELLALCDYQVDDDRRMLSMRKDSPPLSPQGHCELIIDKT